MSFNASCNAETEIIRLASKNCDPLTELLAAVLNIACNCGENDVPDAGTSPHFLFWEAKPQLYTCSIAPCPGSKVVIELHHCPDMYAGIHTADKLRLRFEMELSAITTNLFELMRGLLSRYGLVGYRRQWGRDFPLALLLELHELLFPESRPASGGIKEEIGMLQKISSLEPQVMPAAAKISPDTTESIWHCLK